MTMLDPRMFRGREEDFNQAVYQVVTQLFPLLSNFKAIQPPLPRLSPTEQPRHNPETIASASTEQQAGETGGLLQSAEPRDAGHSPDWDGFDAPTLSLWVGSFDASRCLQRLWGVQHTASYPLHHPQPSNMTPNNPIPPLPPTHLPHSPSHPAPETVCPAPVSTSSFPQSLSQSHSTKLPEVPRSEILASAVETLRSLRGTVSIELRAEAEKPTSPSRSHVIHKAKRPRKDLNSIPGDAKAETPVTPVKEEHEFTAREPHSHTVPWLQRRLLSDGRAFFLPRDNQPLHTGKGSMWGNVQNWPDTKHSLFPIKSEMEN